MRSNDIYDELHKYSKILDDNGYKVLYIGVYGSTNYNLNDDKSDLDVKAIVLPTLDDIIFRKSVSTTIECDNGSIDVKDLLTFYNVIKKGNFSYTESMNTPYWIGYYEIRNMFKSFKPNLKSMYGAMCEKRKALDHEYPSKTYEFEKWGFDPKQFHHILRLYDLLSYNADNNKTVSFIEYQDTEEHYREFDYTRSELIDIKRNHINLTLEQVVSHSDRIISLAKTILNGLNYVYDIEENEIEFKINSYIKREIEKELFNKYKKNSEFIAKMNEN